MENPLTNRRRAERFAQLLEEANGGRRQHLRTPYDEEVGDLVALQRQLAADCEPPEPDPDFRNGLRAMLVATAQREGIGATATPEPAESVRLPELAWSAPEPRRLAAGALAANGAARLRTLFARGPRARTAVIAGVAVGAVAFTGISTASENALPGDPLYGVKRSTERAQLALASSDVGRGQLYLEFAQTRLGEAQTLANDLGRVLSDMDRDTSHGVQLLTTAAANRRDHAALDVIDDFVLEQRRALEGLAQAVGNGDRAPVAGSLELLKSIEERAEQLRANLHQDCPAISAVDALGAVPTDCVALPAPEPLTDTTSPQHPGPAPTGGPAPAEPVQPTTAAPYFRPGGIAGTAEPIPTEAEQTAPDLEAPEDPLLPAPEAGESTLPPTVAPAPEEDPGLLKGINRFLGNLLGN